MADISIRIASEELSDGSLVHGVLVFDVGALKSIELPAYTLQDAHALAAKITAAINAHAVRTACED